MKRDRRAAHVCWDDYAILQAVADRTQRVDCKAWGLEEQMDLCLSALRNAESGAPMTGENWLANLEANRSQKHRNRRRLLQDEYAPTQRSESECHKFRDLCNAETLAQILTKVTAEELEIFQALADGTAYAMLADERSISLAKLKSKIHRCRERLRSLAQ